jgi:hypothetical protein
MLLPVVSQYLAVDHAAGKQSRRSRFWERGERRDEYRPDGGE